MPKFVRNPIVVDARKIVGIGQRHNAGSSITLALAYDGPQPEGPRQIEHTEFMLHGLSNPSLGDYVIVGPQGGALVGKSEFEQDYTPLDIGERGVHERLGPFFKVIEGALEEPADDDTAEPRAPEESIEETPAPPEPAAGENPQGVPPAPELPGEAQNIGAAISVL